VAWSGDDAGWSTRRILWSMCCVVTPDINIHHDMGFGVLVILIVHLCAGMDVI